ncbi:MAG: hypothetical protein AAF664_04515 [Planctomycetota bacterium]
MMTTEEYLEAPGRIAIVGDDPLTLELALYGRFLGFDVKVFAPGTIGSEFSELRETVLPLMPDRALSPLAFSALRAQTEDFAGQPLPTSVGGWIDDALLPLAETDLLRGRVHSNVSIDSCSMVSVESDETANEEEAVEDYAIGYTNDVGDSERWVAEAIVVYGNHCDQLFDNSMPYIRRWECCDLEKLEESLVRGYSKIAELFASWTDRPELDLYQTRWRR